MEVNDDNLLQSISNNHLEGNNEQIVTGDVFMGSKDNSCDEMESFKLQLGPTEQVSEHQHYDKKHNLSAEDIEVTAGTESQFRNDTSCSSQDVYKLKIASTYLDVLSEQDKLIMLGFPQIKYSSSSRQVDLITKLVLDNPMHPNMYSQWKMLQWDPPEFVRAPGGPPSNVAISHVRLSGRAAFMGKVGNDEFGNDLVVMMNKENVQTRAVKFDEKAREACSYMKIIKFDDNGRLKMEKSKESAEDSVGIVSFNLNVQ